MNADRIVANSITAAQIAAATITATQIAAGTITATQIAANTITAAQLAAGIVYAGIVDATTIRGANLILDGTSGTILEYSGAPAAGNLVRSSRPPQAPTPTPTPTLTAMSYTTRRHSRRCKWAAAESRH